MPREMTTSMNESKEKASNLKVPPQRLDKATARLQKGPFRNILDKKKVNK